jgi:hypothetical protein
VIPNLTAGTTTSTAATITSGTITNLASTTGTIATLNSTTGTIATLNSTTGTIGNLSTTLAGDFTISSGTGTLGTTGVTAGTYGSASAIPFLTVDAKGRITSATTGTFSSTPADGSITPAKLSQPFTSATAVASTSGTAIDFTSIPSWAKRITVMFNGVSTSGISTPWLIQLGDSGGIEATGYLAVSSRLTPSSLNAISSNSGFNINVDNASSNVCNGSITITLLDLSTNSWVASGLFANSFSIETHTVGGSKSLSATLDRVRITTSGGANTFDAGSINIMYEG